MIGTCSGGRQTFLFACHTKSIDAAADLWGGRVVMSKEELNPKQPTPPIEFTRNLSCPLLGLFGNQDRAPTPEQVDQHEADSRSTANGTSFTATTAPGTASSTTTGRCTASSRRWTAGKRYSLFLASTWPNNAQMCTSIVEVVGADGAGKGGDGWFD